MPAQPTPGDVHVNRPLTNVAIKYTLDQADFVAGWAFPEVPVANKSDIFVKYSRRDWLRAEAQERGFSEESAGSGFRVDTSNTYNARVYAVHKDIPDQLRSNQDNPFDMDRDATQWVMQQMLLRREIVWMNNFFKVGAWANELEGKSATPGAGQFLHWNDANSEPILDFKNGIRLVQRRTGRKPNRLTFEPFTWDAVAEHPTVIDRIKHTQTGVLDLDLFAQLIGLKAGEVRVAEGVVDTALENEDEDADPTLVDFIMPKGALLAYSSGVPSQLVPTAGLTFSWTGFLGAGQQGQRIKSMRMDLRSADRVEGEMAFDSKQTANELAVFFKTPIA